MWQQLREGKRQLQKLLHDDVVFVSLVLILVAVTAFGLGRWSALENRSTVDTRPVLVPTPVAVPSPTTQRNSERTPTIKKTVGSYVASVNGTKYHALNCPGAKQISEHNKIFFATAEEARAAGYTPASNCTF